MGIRFNAGGLRVELGAPRVRGLIPRMMRFANDPAQGGARPETGTDTDGTRRLLKKGKNPGRRKLLIFALYIAFALTLYLLGAHFSESGELTLTACHKPVVVSGSDMLIHVVDIGEGDCTLVQGGGANILIDAGGSDTGHRVSDYLIDNGVYTLDLVICSHPHADHIGGMDAVISAPEIRAMRVMMPAIPEDMLPYTRAYERLLDAVDAEGCEVVTVSSDTSLSFGALDIYVYAPFARAAFDDLNDWSLCTRFVCGNVSLLCCGDLTSEGEKTLLGMDVPLHSTVFKASHHGARGSNSIGLLRAVSPRLAYVCAGRDNEFGHPSDRVLRDLRDIGAAVYRTDTSGNIVFECGGSTGHVAVRGG